MFDVDLFIGMPVNNECAEVLQKTSAQFISNDDKGLNEVAWNGVNYLGKKIPTGYDFREIELLEKNIQSILKKYLSEKIVQDQSICMIPIIRTKA